MRFWPFFLLNLWIFSSCYRPNTESYQAFYSYLHSAPRQALPMRESDYFLVVLVNARHLDYTDTCSFFHTVAKHPSDGSKTGDVGHAWIYLQGKVNNKLFCLEGGHSGERGLLQAKYFDGIMNYNEWGWANPSSEQMLAGRYEPNPVRYLWETLSDGFFQKGSGGHCPTYAAKVDLTEEQFYSILAFIHPRSYPYRQYAITQHQCASFVSQVASLAGLQLDYQVSMAIEPSVWYGGMDVRLWKDCQYSVITVGSPDIVEKSLMAAVGEGKAEYALDWYLQRAKQKMIERRVLRRACASRRSSLPVPFQSKSI